MCSIQCTGSYNCCASIGQCVTIQYSAIPRKRQHGFARAVDPARNPMWREFRQPMAISNDIKAYVIAERNYYI